MLAFKIDKAGAEIDRRIKKYQEDHPGVSYGDAWRTLLKQEEDQETKALEEIARRVPAYMSEFRIKSYDRALERVLADDRKLKAVYERAQGSAAMELETEAKTYQSEQRMKWLDSVEAAASQQPELAKKVAGDALHRYALTEIEDEKKAGRQISYSAALNTARTQHPELDLMYQSGHVSEQALADVSLRRR